MCLQRNNTALITAVNPRVAVHHVRRAPSAVFAASAAVRTKREEGRGSPLRGLGVKPPGRDSASPSPK